MDEFRIRTRVLDPLGAAERSALSQFLAPIGLELEANVELSVLVEDNGSPIATASLAGNVIKCVGVLPDREGEGAAARAVSAIIAEAQVRNRGHLFVYTKPDNTAIFEDLGFSTLATVKAEGPHREGVALLENNDGAFDDWAEAIKKKLPDGKAAAAVVVNCNPFTLGHRYLIETAARVCSSPAAVADSGSDLDSSSGSSPVPGSGQSSRPSNTLLVLVVAGDRSSFPGAVRETLVREGTADLPNVVVASGGSYCVSGATFPAYYLKHKSRAAELQAALDATLFATKIAPAFGIHRRFVGTEPFCEVTSAYNQAMTAILPKYGIELVTINRIKDKGEAISASRVRTAIQEGDLEKACALVPLVTAAWLRSPAAAPTLARIRTGTGRH